MLQNHDKMCGKQVLNQGGGEYYGEKIMLVLYNLVTKRKVENIYKYQKLFLSFHK